MRRRAEFIWAWLVAAMMALSGCSVGDAGEASSQPPMVSTTAPSTSAAPPGRPVVTAPVPPLPVAEDQGYADAVATFGAAEINAALAADAYVARLALADCHRWTTGEIHRDLHALLDPELLSRVEVELARPEGSTRSLLAPLPDDDGNGNNLEAAVRGGCDASAPLRIYVGSYNLDSHQLLLRVDRSGARPALVVNGAFVMNVTLGGVQVSAGRDWQFTSVIGEQGWVLTDVASAGANVNWAPIPPA